MRARIKKATGGFDTTTATALHNATEFIAACARPVSAKAYFCLKPHAATHATQAKRFATLQAQFALLGHTLHQSGPSDGPGPVSYLAERWGMARHLPALDDADQFLIQLGGAGHEL